MSQEAEKHILASIIFKSEDCDYAFQNLKLEYFVNDEHKKIFKEMLTLRDKGTHIDLISLGEITKNNNLIMDLATISFTTARIKNHTNLMVDNFYKKTSYKKLLEIAENLKKNNESIPDLKSKIEELAGYLSERTIEKGLQTLAEISKENIKNFEIIAKGGSPGVKTGFKKLDESGFFFRKKTLNILAARPMMGKSSLALDIAKKCDVNTAFFSIEMSAEEQYERLLSPIVQLTGDQFREKEKINSFSSQIMDAIQVVNKHKIWISEDRKTTVPSIISQCRRLNSEFELGLIIVDYLGLIEPTGDSQSRREEVSQISKMLKQASSDLNLPILALCQLNRECESRPDKRPLLSDLRETGSIEQDAHMVIFIYREEIYDKSAEKGKAEIIVRKNRGGRIGRVPLYFNSKFTTFEDYNETEEFYSSIHGFEK